VLIDSAVVYFEVRDMQSLVWFGGGDWTNQG
jgi:hypothetical protein